MPLEPGAHLNNRYRITSVIAQGGMGAIYRAFDESLGVEVALKENLFSSEEATRQFHREATLLAGLRHPNLPRVTDHFVLSGQGQYLVMDYIDGEDIRQRLTHQVITEEEAIAIGVAVCDALAYLHSRVPPVVHRDIKPGNVKITPGGQVFLVDFGLAKVSQPGQATTTGAQALTPGYAPPEQYGQGTTPASDIYALGATLYAALTGKIPEDALARAMGSAQLTPLRTHNPELSERIAQVIDRAMAVRPQDRYPSANEFRLALLSISSATPLRSAQADVPAQNQPGIATDATIRGGISGPLPPVTTPQRPASPQPPSVPIPAPAPSRRKTNPAAIIGGAAVLILISIAVVLLLGNNPSAPAQNATLAPTQLIQPTFTPPAPTATLALPTLTLPAAIPTAIPYTPTITVTTPPTATLTPAPTAIGGGQGQIAFVSLRSGLPQIWLMTSDGKNQTQLTNLPDGACQPDWSPDGKRLVFVSPCRNRQNEYRGSTLYLVNADGTNLTPLPSMPGGDFDPAWSPDGQKIAFTSLRETIQHIFIFNLSDNRVSRISAESSFDGKPAWSPDGKYIAFESTRLGTLQIWVMESNGQNAKMVSTQSTAVAFSPQWSRDGLNLIYNREQAMPILYIKQFKDLAPEFKVSEEIRPVANASYSADGQWIVFERWVNNNTDIYRMAYNGGNLTPLTSDPAVDYHPVWRP